MNKFKKYCLNVWVAECENEYKKGDIIQLETKYGKEVDCKVYNLISKKENLFYYSIVRIEAQTYAERKKEKYENSVMRNQEKSTERYQASLEGHNFLSLGEPIHIGHSSESKHRALIERSNKRMEKSIEYADKAKKAENKAKYWDKKAQEINLSMPESIEYFKHKLEKATAYQKGLKDGSIEREHAYSLTYATKEVKESKKKVETANLLWGEQK